MKSKLESEKNNKNKHKINVVEKKMKKKGIRIDMMSVM